MGVALPRLVYIAAWGRSGSTILGNILGALPSAFDAGELRHFWSRIGRPDHACGCGRPLDGCPFWGEVHEELLGDAELPTRDLRLVRGWQEEAVRIRRTRRVVAASSVSDLPEEPFGRYVAALRCLYRSIARVSAAEVVVDSSKKAGYGALAGLASGTRPVFVHLVRDPRATAFSWQRLRKAGPYGDREMPRHGTASSSVNWVVCNLSADRLRRRAQGTGMRIRYEDLLRSPRTVVGELAEAIGYERPGPPFVDDHTVDLPANHTFAGNPSRFAHGRVVLARDDEWIHAQRRTDRLVCDLITLPLLSRYGYPYRLS